MEDGDGKSVSYLTNSFVSFLWHSFRDLKDKTLLEIGSGESNVYWSNYFKAKCVAMRMIHNATYYQCADNVDLVLQNFIIFKMIFLTQD